MEVAHKTIIIRHRKENLKKCSLSGLETRKDLIFLTYPAKEFIFDAANYFVLAMDAPVLSLEDTNKGLLLIDGTWKHAEKILKRLPDIERRSLPNNLKTAYPRKQTFCPNPKQGLASIEALYAAYKILKKETSNLLDHYYWKDLFLQMNPFLSN